MNMSFVKLLTFKMQNLLLSLENLKLLLFFFWGPMAPNNQNQCSTSDGIHLVQLSRVGIYTSLTLLLEPQNNVKIPR